MLVIGQKDVDWGSLVGVSCNFPQRTHAELCEQLEGATGGGLSLPLGGSSQAGSAHQVIDGKRHLGLFGGEHVRLKDEQDGLQPLGSPAKRSKVPTQGSGAGHMDEGTGASGSGTTGYGVCELLCCHGIQRLFLVHRKSFASAVANQASCCSRAPWVSLRQLGDDCSPITGDVSNSVLI